MRVFGIVKPSIRIDSYKSEKKILQKITNTINIRLTPSIDDNNRIQDFVASMRPNSIKSPIDENMH